MTVNLSKMACTENSEKYRLMLNFEGTDYEICVSDLETANLLLNDHEAAAQFLAETFDWSMKEEASNQLNQTNQEEDQTKIMNVTESSSKINERNLEEEDQYKEILNVPSTSACNSKINDIIWTRKKPNDKDNEATSLLLSLREKYENSFGDKKTRKSKLWNDIAKIIEDSGFQLGENGGERCRQKFCNLQKVYLSYIKHQKTTGTEKSNDLPPFFNEIHSILGSKDKVNPQKLEDSMDVVHEENVFGAENKNQETKENYEKIEEISKPSSSTPKGKEYSDRFKRATRKITPSKQDELLKEVREDRKKRDEEFGFLKQYLKKSEKQKDRFLDILEAIYVGKKRKREEMSSDSE